MLSLAEMTAIVNAGGAVLFENRVITSVANLPTEAQIKAAQNALVVTAQNSASAQSPFGRLATAAIDAGESTAQVIYTAPAGYNAIVTGLVARNLSGGVAQQETATAAGTASSSANATVTVTAAGMTNSPKAVTVALASGDTATVVAGKIRTALTADADVSAFFTVSGTGTAIVLTAKTMAPNDATMNIAIGAGTTGITAAPTSANTTAGKDLSGTVDFGIGATADAWLADMDLTTLVSASNNYVAMPSDDVFKVVPSGSNFTATMGSTTSGAQFFVDVIGYVVPV